MASSAVQDDALCAELLRRGFIRKPQLEYVLRKQLATSRPLASLMVHQGLVGDRDIAPLLAQVRGLPYRATLSPAEVSGEATAMFRREVCEANGMLPYSLADGRLHLWIGEGEPRRIETLVSRRVGLPVHLEQGPFGAVALAIEAAYAPRREDARETFDRECRRIEQDESGSLGTEPLVQSLIALAVSDRATDIHLTPDHEVLVLSFRVDGVLLPIVALSKRFVRLVSAIKVAAGMDIGDNLRPQDGRFGHQATRGPIDVRVSTTVTPFGESVVMRLLLKGSFNSSLDDLGFYPEHVPLLRDLFSQPYGMVLMTGPTGSGKTTTLYAGLRPLAMSGKSVLTVEDPVEYDLPGACQTQVNRKAGYLFSNAIRHFLRHDPDIMLVGEIRDGETAEAAMRAAETGHLVLSTLHVNNTLGVPHRLASLGVPTSAVAETLLGVVTQRLVRRLCLACRELDPTPAGELPRPLRGRLDGAPLYRPVGCPQCRGTGYAGRLPVYEMLLMDGRLSRWIAAGAHRQDLGGVIDEANHVSMQEVYVRRLREGDLSLEEFRRTFGAFDELGLGLAAHEGAKP